MRTSIRIAIVALVIAAFVAPAQAAFAGGLCGIEITTPGTIITLTEDLHCSGRGIIVSADHGENLGELGIYVEHGTADDATCHVPFVIK